MNYALIAVYIAAMTTANLLVWWLGPWFSPINAFFLIGLDLTLRDVMQERLGRWQIAGVIIAGGALTWLLNPSASHIAIASATAFTVSAAVDWAVYSWLKPRPWMIRSNGSNVVGAAVDSILHADDRRTPVCRQGLWRSCVVACPWPLCSEVRMISGVRGMPRWNGRKAA
jgi:uncharacterized PurR-regulated membrane protein YhhQ (DUF165 family)